MPVNSIKLLIVDDEREIRSMLRILLETEGFDVVDADSGKAALHRVILDKPNLIVLDPGLPDMDGQNSLRWSGLSRTFRSLS